jgi:hypothetical protein
MDLVADEGKSLQKLRNMHWELKGRFSVWRHGSLKVHNAPSLLPLYFPHNFHCVLQIWNEKGQFIHYN